MWFVLAVLRRIGLIRLGSPWGLVRAGHALATWGPGFPSGIKSAAARFPDRTAVIDDAGAVTWAELSTQVDQLTQALKDRGIRSGDSVAVLARNHRYLVLIMSATMQIGARALLLNTMASGQQLADLVGRESAGLVVLDEEFLEVAQSIDPQKLLLAWADPGTRRPNSLAHLIASTPHVRHRPPKRRGQIIIFTSGTSGLPKGARREEPRDLKPLVSFFGAIPWRGGDVVVLAAPMFHSWGLINFGFGLLTAPTYVLRRRFDAAQVLDDIRTHRARVLVAVPLMLQRLVDLPEQVQRGADTRTLDITACSGSALTGDLAADYMDAFGDSIYNFYGSTETGWVTIARPEDLRAAPGTAGTAPWRTTVKVLGEDGREVPTGMTGVIHVGSDMPFGGYTDGNTKSFVDGLMSTGDVGHVDANGLLFVSGRDDDMIISGGENVFPQELEDALARHPSIADVAVVGVEDPQWGQRLAAFVVLRNGLGMDESELVAYARLHVARFAVPREVHFLHELPRNATGKVIKHQLGR